MSDYMDRLVDRCNFNFWGPLLYAPLPPVGVEDIWETGVDRARMTPGVIDMTDRENT